jgi:hypothetical protein
VAAVTAIVLVLLLAPYVRFLFIHPDMLDEHLHNLDSPWVHDTPVAEKATHTASQYLRGLSPAYWFLDNEEELVRHRLKGYGHLPLWAAPLLALGLGCGLWRWRNPRWRALLIAVMAAPFSAALVDILITRVLAMMVPATLLVSLGLVQVYRWLPSQVVRRILAGLIAVGLAAYSGWMTADALRNGPRWFNNYGLYGMQYGASQLFGALAEEHQRDPGRRFLVDHSWANNPNAFLEFFLSPSARDRIELIGPDQYLEHRLDLSEPTTFVLTAHELDRTVATRLVEIRNRSRVLFYPNGTPGFVFAELAYTPLADTFFKAAEERRKRPVEITIEVRGEVLHIQHPWLDMGGVEDLFDGRARTLMRTYDANPCRLEISPDPPRPVSAVAIQLRGHRYEVFLEVLPVGSGLPVRIRRQLKDLPADPWIELELPDGPVVAERLIVVVARPGDGHVHIREIRIL